MKKIMFLLALTVAVFAQTNLVRVPASTVGGSGAKCQLRGVAGTRTAAIDSINGVYNNPYFEFTVTTSGRYDLYYDSNGTTGGLSYSKQTDWSGTYGRWIDGMVDAERALTLQETADTDNDGKVETAGLEDSVITDVKIAASVKDTLYTIDTQLDLKNKVSDYALSFTATDSPVKIAKISDLTAFTLIAKAKPSTISGALQVITCDSSGFDNALLLGIYPENGAASEPQAKWSLILQDSASSTRKVLSADTASVDEYTTLWATYDGTTIKLYVDGELKDSEAASGWKVSSRKNWYIGGNAGTPTLRKWLGSIDEIQLYDNVLNTRELMFASSTNKTYSGLVFKYDFEDGSGTTALDASTNNYDLTVANEWAEGYNTADFTKIPEKRISYENIKEWERIKFIKNRREYFGLEFDGQDGKLLTINDLEGSWNNYTVMAWVKPANRTQVSNIFSNDSSGFDNSLHFGINVETNGVGASATGKWTFQIQDTATSSRYGVSSLGYANTTDITYLAGTYDGTNLKFYVNGDSVGVHAQAGLGLTTAKAYFKIGGSAHPDNRNWVGDIYAIRFYSSALTSAQIALATNDQSTINNLPTTNLVRSWDFNEGYGTEYIDDSANRKYYTSDSLNWITDTKKLYTQNQDTYGKYLYRVALMSDIQVRNNSEFSEVENVVKQLNAFKPSFTVIAGDIGWPGDSLGNASTGTAHYDSVYNKLAMLDSAWYFTAGNHDNDIVSGDSNWVSFDYFVRLADAHVDSGGYLSGDTLKAADGFNTRGAFTIDYRGVKLVKITERDSIYLVLHSHTNNSGSGSNTGGIDALVATNADTAWLHTVLDSLNKPNRKVIVVDHYPPFNYDWYSPATIYDYDNATAVRQLVDNYSNVMFYHVGHVHRWGIFDNVETGNIVYALSPAFTRYSLPVLEAPGFYIADVYSRVIVFRAIPTYTGTIGAKSRDAFYIWDYYYQKPFYIWSE